MKLLLIIFVFNYVIVLAYNEKLSMKLLHEKDKIHRY